MKQITRYVSPEVNLLTLTDMGILCASNNQFETEQNEGIIEKEYNW